MLKKVYQYDPKVLANLKHTVLPNGDVVFPATLDFECIISQAHYTEGGYQGAQDGLLLRFDKSTASSWDWYWATWAISKIDSHGIPHHENDLLKAYRTIHDKGNAICASAGVDRVEELVGLTATVTTHGTGLQYGQALSFRIGNDRYYWS
jgi:hypothetical protein